MAAAQQKKEVCATCVSCDVRNNGYCENETVRKLLEFDGIIADPKQFGCIYHKKEK